MRTIKLTLMYDGTRYVGWQAQPNGVSIQALLQKAVCRMTGKETPVIGASRTDAGVHALGQVAHFRTSMDVLCDGFKMGLNSLLPEDIAVVGAEEAAEGFNSRRDAKGKRYLYRLLISGERRPLIMNRFWQMGVRPGLDRLREAASVLVGKHDFASFKAAGCSSRNAVREIKNIEITHSFPSPLRGEGQGEGGNCNRVTLPPTPSHQGRENCDEIIDITIEGNGFVRHMVRNIVGTLVDIGLGKIELDAIKGILEARRREQAGRCAPACGLYLMEVLY
ncbi:MAG: tRNA pseudouridine synthase A [Pseudomonadota bacterium]